MIYVCAKVQIDPEKTEEFLRIAGQLVKATRNEPDCIEYDLCKGDDEKTFYFAERWKNESCLEAHFVTEHFKSAMPLIGELSVAEPQIEIMKRCDI